MSSMAEPIVRRSAAARRIDFSPYLVGVGLGVLSWIAFAVAKDPLGVTTAMSRVASQSRRFLLGSEAAAKNAIGRRCPSPWDYGVLFLVGALGGALLAH